jgi:hypothetical protein
VSERGRLGVLAFGAYDYLATVEGDVRDVLLDSDFHRVDLRYDHELDDGGSLRVSTTLGLDRSRGLGVQDARDTRLHSRVTFKRPLGGGVLLRGGLDVALDVFDVVPGGAQECTTFLCDSGGLGSSTESELAEAFEVLFPSRLDLSRSAAGSMPSSCSRTARPSRRACAWTTTTRSGAATWRSTRSSRGGSASVTTFGWCLRWASPRSSPGFRRSPACRSVASRGGCSGRCRRASAQRATPGPSTCAAACSATPPSTSPTRSARVADRASDPSASSAARRGTRTASSSPRAERSRPASSSSPRTR